MASASLDELLAGLPQGDADVTHLRPIVRALLTDYLAPGKAERVPVDGADVALRWIRYLCLTAPDVFVAGDPSGAPSSGEDVSVFWAVRQLLQLVATPACAHAHDTACNVIALLLVHAAPGPPAEAFASLCRVALDCAELSLAIARAHPSSLPSSVAVDVAVWVPIESSDNSVLVDVTDPTVRLCVMRNAALSAGHMVGLAPQALASMAGLQLSIFSSLSAQLASTAPSSLPLLPAVLALVRALGWVDETAAWSILPVLVDAAARWPELSSDSQGIVGDLLRLASALGLPLSLVSRMQSEVFGAALGSVFQSASSATAPQGALRHGIVALAAAMSVQPECAPLLSNVFAFNILACADVRAEVVRCAVSAATHSQNARADVQAAKRPRTEGFELATGQGAKDDALAAFLTAAKAACAQADIGTLSPSLSQAVTSALATIMHCTCAVRDAVPGIANDLSVVACRAWLRCLLIGPESVFGSVVDGMACLAQLNLAQAAADCVLHVAALPFVAGSSLGFAEMTPDDVAEEAAEVAASACELAPRGASMPNRAPASLEAHTATACLAAVAGLGGQRYRLREFVFRRALGSTHAHVRVSALVWLPTLTRRLLRPCVRLVNVAAGSSDEDIVRESVRCVGRTACTLSPDASLKAWTSNCAAETSDGGIGSGLSYSRRAFVGGHPSWDMQCARCGLSDGADRKPVSGSVLPEAREAFAAVEEDALACLSLVMHSRPPETACVCLSSLLCVVRHSEDRRALLERPVQLSGAGGTSLNGRLLDALLLWIGAADEGVRAFAGRVLAEALACCDGRLSAGEKMPIYDRVTDRLHELVGGRDLDVCRSSLRLIGMLGRIGADEFLPVVNVSLLEFVAHADALVRSVAVEEIRAVAKSRQMSVLSLVCPQDTVTARVVVGRMRTGAPFTEALHSLFEPRELRQFLAAVRQHALPDAIARRDEASLGALARSLSTTPSALIHSQFGPIFASLSMDANTTEEEKKAVLQFVLRVAQAESPDIHIGDIMERQISAVIRELLSQSGLGEAPGAQLASQDEDRQQRAIAALRTVAKQTGTYGADVDYVGLVEDNLLGAIHGYNVIRDAAAPMADRRHALLGLLAIMSIVRSRALFAVRPKVMAMLRAALQEPQLAPIALRGWDTLVRRIDRKRLGALAAQIVVTLTPAAETHPDEVAATLSFLFVDNADVVAPHIDDVHDVPMGSAFAAVRAAVNRMRRPLSAQARLHHRLAGISHDNPAVRVAELRRLKTLLREDRAAITGLVAGQDTVDESVAALVHALIAGCRDTDPTARRLTVECLGELGAVDPGRILAAVPSASAGGGSGDASLHRRAPELPDIDSPQFPRALISDHLVKALLAADTEDQDLAAYAIQEALRLAGVTGGDGLTQGTAADRLRQLGFSDDDCILIAPFLSSGYRVTSKQTSVRRPIYRNVSSFQHWLSEWAVDLGLRLRRGTRAQKVFEVCRGVIRKNVDVALALLPQAVFHAVAQESGDDVDDARAYILEEINAVVEDAIAGAALEGAAALAGGDAGAASTSVCAGSDSLGTERASMRQMCCQAVFSAIDYLFRFERKNILEARPAAHGGSSRKQKETAPVRDARLPQVSQFLDSLALDRLALAAHHSDAHARALLYLETHLRRRGGSSGTVEEDRDAALQSQLPLMQRAFASMDEPDGMAGVAALRKLTTLKDAILDHECGGDWGSALACREQALRLDPESPAHHAGLLNCLLNLGHLETMLMHATGLAVSRRETETSIAPLRARAAWRLGRWDLLEECVGSAEVSGSAAPGAVRLAAAEDFEMSLGRILLKARAGNAAGFRDALAATRDALVVPLSAASMEAGAYQRGYPSIVRLHMLRELEHAVAPVLAEDGAVGVGVGRAASMALFECSTEWGVALRLTQPSYRARESILNLRRIVVSLLSDKNAAVVSAATALHGDLWLQSARVARKGGLFQVAYSALLNADALGAQEAAVAVERAKIVWDRGDQHEALAFLQAELVRKRDVVHAIVRANTTAPRPKRDKPVQWLAHYLDLQPAQPRDPAADELGKTVLLAGRWMESTGQSLSNDIIAQYQRVIELCPQWEKGYFHLGKYYDRILQSEGHAEHTRACLPHIVANYGLALAHGSQFIFQSLPRILTLWLDYGARFPETEQAGANKTKGKASDKSDKTPLELLSQLNSIMRTLEDRLPPYQFITALPQLLSRLCHSNASVTEILRDIIRRLVVAFPQQTLWALMLSHKSNNAQRRRRCAEILDSVRQRNPTMHDITSKFIDLANILTELCEYNADNRRELSVSSDFSTLRRMMPLPVIIPLERSLQVRLPSDTRDTGSFPDNLPTFEVLRDRIELLSSMQRPRKLVVQGSDGVEYPLLCKPNDDLRRDARMMEFSQMVNRLLKRDAESRKRQLNIRTYGVVALNEECGLLEWVPHTMPIRPIIYSIYDARGVDYSSSHIKSLFGPIGVAGTENGKGNNHIKQHEIIAAQKAIQDGVSRAKEFKTSVLPAFPPVFYEWFLTTFPEPSSWYSARVAYARTAAVMSMVGQAVGLGDRHGENILMDAKTGECVHVDFNCIFFKGSKFAVPEKVPFRLTHNMTDAMGPTGYEGLFRRTCEVTLRVMRRERESLMAVLETFIHDPLVEWGTEGRRDRSGDPRNPSAVDMMVRIDGRLQGKPTTGLPLSIEGQVHQLIAEATSPENLCEMFVGWGPFL